MVDLEDMTNSRDNIVRAVLIASDCGEAMAATLFGSAVGILSKYMTEDELNSYLKASEKYAKWRDVEGSEKYANEEM